MNGGRYENEENGLTSHLSKMSSPRGLSSSQLATLSARVCGSVCVLVFVAALYFVSPGRPRCSLTSPLPRVSNKCLLSTAWGRKEMRGVVIAGKRVMMK